MLGSMLKLNADKLAQSAQIDIHAVGDFNCSCARALIELDIGAVRFWIIIQFHR